VARGLQKRQRPKCLQHRRLQSCKRPVRIYAWTFAGKHLLYLQDTGGDKNHHV
jgi:hypothetical protein